MADALVLGASTFGVWVRPPSPAPTKFPGQDKSGDFYKTFNLTQRAMPAHRKEALLGMAGIVNG